MAIVAKARTIANEMLRPTRKHILRIFVFVAIKFIVYPQTPPVQIVKTTYNIINIIHHTSAFKG